jgi:NAD(P)-dependent dehydrogenase (short-subunit alcohol dehydrogenase family)
VRRRSLIHPAAAACAGAALGIGIEAGVALLLYADTGVLATVGLLASLALGALAAGLWVGAPESPHATSAQPSKLADRWLVAGAIFIAAGIFALFWSGSRGLSRTGFGRALAVLLLIAGPAYAIGAVLSGINHAPRNRKDDSGAIAVGAALGAAVGILLAAVVLIPRLDASVLFVATGGFLASFGFWWGRWTANHSLEAEMDQKVAIITGVGGKGQVGYALAEAFLARGARVAITDISPRVKEHAAGLGEATRVAAVAADLTTQSGAASVAALVHETFGRLDYLVNVAGGLSVIKPLADTSPDEWQRELERNASTVFFMTRAVLPLLREHGGAIVNFASPAALAAPATLGAYAAAKAAVIALTRTIAVEEKANGIRANALAPGNIDTEQNRKAMSADAKFVTREQVINAVMLLLSDEASGITGETIKVLGETIA